MEYQVRIQPFVERRIAQWGLSDYLLIEVYLALREVLPGDPLGHLHRDPDGPGSLFAFDRTDPDSPRFKHVWMFRVFFDEDERLLHVMRGSYWRSLQS